MIVLPQNTKGDGMQSITSNCTGTLVFNDECSNGSLKNISLGLSFIAEAAERTTEGLTINAMKGMGAIVDVLRAALETATSKVRENEKELHKEIKRLGDEAKVKHAI